MYYHIKFQKDPKMIDLQGKYTTFKNDPQLKISEMRKGKLLSSLKSFFLEYMLATFSVRPDKSNSY